MNKLMRLANRLQAYGNTPRTWDQPIPPRVHTRPSLPTTPVRTRNVERRALTDDDLATLTASVHERESGSPRQHAEARRLINELRSRDVVKFYALRESLRWAATVADDVSPVCDLGEVSIRNILENDRDDNG